MDVTSCVNATRQCAIDLGGQLRVLLPRLESIFAIVLGVCVQRIAMFAGPNQIGVAGGVGNDDRCAARQRKSSVVVVINDAVCTRQAFVSESCVLGVCTYGSTYQGKERR
jgi:hypothetical protein